MEHIARSSDYSQQLLRIACCGTAAWVLGVALTAPIRGADLAIYDFTGGSAASSDVHAPTTAGNFFINVNPIFIAPSTISTAPVGMIDAAEGRVRVLGSETGPGANNTPGDPGAPPPGNLAGNTIENAIANGTYQSFTLNTNGTNVNFGSLGFNYTSQSPSGGFNINVFTSATGFLAENRLATFTTTGATNPGNVSVDLSQFPALQAFNGALEVRFYYVDGSNVSTRIHFLDNVVLSDLGSVWIAAAGGQWSTGAYWSTNPAVPGVGGAAGADALLGGAIAANATVDLDAAVTLNRLKFQNAAASYSVNPVNAATHTITLNGAAELNAVSGSHEVAARIVGSSG
ncbi:MAG: hypothetical protein KF847_17605, partial [Pirellulales bacterium]|nr:hypothetical protein [Pirellulales bacterium]